MTQTALDVLADLGADAAYAFWLPVLAWTALALPFWAFLHWTRRLHPNAEYRLSQVLLAALPVGIGAASLANWLPAAPPSALLPAQSVVVLPPIETMPRSAPSGSWSWTHVVGLLTGGALGLGLFRLSRLALEVVAARRVRRRLAAAAPPSLRAELERLRRRLGVGRPVRVFASSDVAVPITLGGLRPTVLVPSQLVDATTSLTLTLRHELIHIRRWDDLAQLVERFIAALFAVHPLVGRLRRQIDAARERACDAAVLDDGATPPGEYARLLATFADGAAPPRIGALSLSESSSSLIDRLSAMRSSKPSLLSSRPALGLALAVVGLILTVGVAACSDTAGPSLSPGPDGSDASSPSALQRATVDVPPTLVGGLAAVQESIDYPETAREAGIEGRVIVQFVVDEKGTVTDPSIAHGAHETLNEAALQAVVSQSFTPGQKEGAPVPVRMSLPVTFRLGDASSPASSDDATGSDAAPDPASGGRLFEKAGIQIVRVLMNEDGHLLLDGERVGGSDLPAAVRRHITKDAARAVLLHADGAPADRIAAAEARLRSLGLQDVYVRTAE